MKEVEVVHNGMKYKVVIGKITYGQRNEIIKKCMRTKLESGRTMMDIMYPDLEFEVAVRAIKKVEPVVQDIRKWLSELEVDEAMKIISVAMNLNPLF